MAGAEETQRITDLQTTMTQIRLLHAALLDQIAELERCQTAKQVGYKDTRALLLDALRVAPNVASRMVAQSALVTETLTPTGHTTPAPLPTVRTALHDGLLDPEHITAIAETVGQLPDWVSLQDRTLVESTLAETARTHSPRAVRRHGDTLLARIDQDGTSPTADHEQAEPHNWFRSQRDRTGRMKFRGELEPETAEIFDALLGDLATPQPLAKDIPDPRSTEERYGDAMAELVYRRMTASEQATIYGCTAAERCTILGEEITRQQNRLRALLSD